MRITTKQIDEKIKKYEELQKIVISMKSVASANVKKAQDLISSLREYERSILDLIALMLSHFPRLGMREIPVKGSIVVVFGSDLGLCGVFNERVAEKATSLFKGKELKGYLVVGRKLSDIIEHKKIKVFRAPTHYEAIYSRASELIEEVSEILRNEVFEIYTVYNQFSGIGKYKPVVKKVFPFEVRIGKSDNIPPVLDIPPEDIIKGLIMDYVFAMFYTAFLESFLSENGVRLMNMNSASSSIGKNLERLKMERNYYRQEEITAEIEEIMSTYKALSQE